VHLRNIEDNLNLGRQGTSTLIGRASDCNLLGKNKLSYDHHQPIIVFAVTVDDSAGNSAPSAPAVVTCREQVVGSFSVTSVRNDGDKLAKLHDTEKQALIVPSPACNEIILVILHAYTSMTPYLKAPYRLGTDTVKWVAVAQRVRVYL
jgi:hypothetical protein